MSSVGTLLQITYLTSRKAYLVIMCLNSYETLTKIKLGQVGVGSNIAKITLIASRKSYMANICPNTSNKLTKSELRSSWSRFEHLSKSLFNPLGSHIWSLFAPIHMTSWPKSKLDKVGVGSNIAQNHSSAHMKSYLIIICPKYKWKVIQNWSSKLKDIEVNWEVIYDFLYSYMCF